MPSSRSTSAEDTVHKPVSMPCPSDRDAAERAAAVIEDDK